MTVHDQEDRGKARLKVILADSPSDPLFIGTRPLVKFKTQGDAPLSQFQANQPTCLKLRAAADEARRPGSSPDRLLIFREICDPDLMRA